MAYHDPDEEIHPSAEHIVLNDDNETLRGELLSGIERAITSDFSFTVDVKEDNWQKKVMSNPYPTSLARIAFLKYDGISLEDIDQDAATTRPEEMAESSPTPLFQLAVKAEAHSLDKEKATKLTPEEIEKLGLVWPDGLTITLLDCSYSNMATWGFCFQPGLRRNNFSFSGSKSGFVKTEKPESDLLSIAYGIDSSLGSGASITEDGMDYLDGMRIMNQLLQRGTFDADTSANFAQAAEEASGITLLNKEIDVIQGSLPYFKRIIKGSLTSPDFRDSLAWQQYCEHRWGQKR